MTLVERDTKLWLYLAPEIKGLIEDGEILIDFILEHKESSKISDFSFLVFPFAKAYEGFLKRLFLDMEIIKPDEYYSDDIRIGRILNPHYRAEKGNVFQILCEHSPEKQELSDKLWAVWKKGRNSVFHYFPHNFRRLDYEEATELIHDFINAMNDAVCKCGIPEDKLKSIENVATIAGQ